MFFPCLSGSSDHSSFYSNKMEAHWPRLYTQEIESLSEWQAPASSASACLHSSLSYCNFSVLTSSIRTMPPLPTHSAALDLNGWHREKLSTDITRAQLTRGRNWCGTFQKSWVCVRIAFRARTVWVSVLLTAFLGVIFLTFMCSSRNQSTAWISV